MHWDVSFTFETNDLSLDDAMQIYRTHLDSGKAVNYIKLDRTSHLYYVQTHEGDKYENETISITKFEPDILYVNENKA